MKSLELAFLFEIDFHLILSVDEYARSIDDLFLFAALCAAVPERAAAMKPWRTASNAESGVEQAAVALQIEDELPQRRCVTAPQNSETRNLITQSAAEAAVGSSAATVSLIRSFLRPGWPARMLQAGPCAATAATVWTSLAGTAAVDSPRRGLVRADYRRRDQPAIKSTLYS